MFVFVSNIIAMLTVASIFIPDGRSLRLVKIGESFVKGVDQNCSTILLGNLRL